MSSSSSCSSSADKKAPAKGSSNPSESKEPPANLISYEYDGCSIIFTYESKPMPRDENTTKEGLPSDEAKVLDSLIMDVVHKSTQRRWRYRFFQNELSAKFPGITCLKAMEKTISLLVEKHEDIKLEWEHNPNDQLDLDCFDTLGMHITITTLINTNSIYIELEKVTEPLEVRINRVVLNLESELADCGKGFEMLFKRVKDLEEDDGDEDYEENLRVKIKTEMKESIGALVQSEITKLASGIKTENMASVKAELKKEFDGQITQLKASLAEVVKKKDELSKKYDELAARVTKLE